MRKILCLSAMLMCGVMLANSAMAEDSWPTPPENWWTSLKGGEQATFMMQMGPTTMKMVVTVDSIEGSSITYSTQTYMGENAMPPQTQTIDAASEPQGAGGGLPDGATVTKGEDTTVKVGETDFTCTVYEVTVQGMSMKCWHSPQLPPIFSGGNVKMETAAGGQNTTISLTNYTGNLVDGGSSEGEGEDEDEDEDEDDDDGDEGEGDEEGEN